MPNKQITESVQELTEEYLNGDIKAKTGALRELSGYVRALVDTGQQNTAAKVAGIVTTLMREGQS